MIRVIPAILAKTKEEFLSKVDAVRDFAYEVQLDIMDGEFVPNATWGDPEEIKKLDLPSFEVHLMVENPEKYAEPWVSAGAKRITAHLEALKDASSFIKAVGRMGCEVGVALNPETPTEKILDIIDILDAVIVMGVNPGFSGQEFQPMAIKKVEEIRKLNKSVAIEVDGGVSERNAVELVEAGTTGLVVASAIFNARDPKTAYEKLLKIANASHS